MRRTAADVTIENLIKQGWKISHNALTNRYCFAGAVTKMKTRNNTEYCRVHHGKTIKNGRYQETTVMMREEGVKA